MAAANLEPTMGKEGPSLGLVASITACCAPFLLAYNLSPSPTFLNQALAIVLWGWFVAFMALSIGSAPLTSTLRQTRPLLLALGLVGTAAMGSWLLGHLPRSLALSGAGLVAAAMLMVVSGAAVRGGPRASLGFALFCWGWVAAGAVNSALAFVQVFAPLLPDGDWIAHSGIPGRAVGNIRQPNHLSSLLLWSTLAAVALLETGRLRRAWVALLMAAAIFAVMLTASRTGLVSVLLLAVWGAVDRRLSRSGRGLLLASPVLYALGWVFMAWWAADGGHVFGGTARLGEADLSGSRFAIWANTIELIRQQPLVGVGFGEFNFAWTLTPFPSRPIAFFDHSHNLPLQFAAEFGLPLAALILALLGWGLLVAWRPGVDDSREDTMSQRCAWMVVAMVGLHSQLEYPLWYAYFLLPAAWAWGFALGRRSDKVGRGHELVMGGVLLAVAGGLSVLDYLRVVAIFEAPEHAPPLETRIAEGQRSLLFSHHADYAAATTEGMADTGGRAFDGATHYLLDTRLMTAWAEDLAQQGHADKARYLAARLREFRNPASKEFFDVCNSAGLATGTPFQCQAPTQAINWRDFTRR